MRPHRRRARIVQSYSPCDANAQPPSMVPGDVNKDTILKAKERTKDLVQGQDQGLGHQCQGQEQALDLQGQRQNQGLTLCTYLTEN